MAMMSNRTYACWNAVSIYVLIWLGLLTESRFDGSRIVDCSRPFQYQMNRTVPLHSSGQSGDCMFCRIPGQTALNVLLCIMVSHCKDEYRNHIPVNLIYQSVLMIDSSGPCSAELTLLRLRLSRSCKRMLLQLTKQILYLRYSLWVRGFPIIEIFHRLWCECNLIAHRCSPLRSCLSLRPPFLSGLPAPSPWKP